MDSLCCSFQCDSVKAQVGSYLSSTQNSPMASLFYSDEKLKDLAVILMALQDLHLSLLSLSPWPDLSMPPLPSLSSSPPSSIPATSNSYGLWMRQAYSYLRERASAVSSAWNFFFISAWLPPSTFRLLLKWHFIWEAYSYLSVANGTHVTLHAPFCTYHHWMQHFLVCLFIRKFHIWKLDFHTSN